MAKTPCLPNIFVRCNVDFEKRLMFYGRFFLVYLFLLWCDEVLVSEVTQFSSAEHEIKIYVKIYVNN